MRKKVHFLQNGNFILLFLLFFGVCHLQAQTPASALDFDGVNDQVNLGNTITTKLNGTNKLTVESWVKTTTTTGTRTIIANHGNGFASQFDLRSSDGKFNAMIGYGTYFIAGGTIIPNTWQHVAMVFDGVTLKLYVDGVNVGTLATPSYKFDESIGNVTIGNNGYNEIFQGKMEEIRVWNRALTETEIQSNKNYELAAGLTGLIAYYNFNQGTDSGSNLSETTLKDASGNSIDGTLNNFGLSSGTSNWVGSSPIVSGIIAPSLLLYTVIPDTAFEEWLINNGIDNDGIINHQVLTANIRLVTELNYYGINDFTGIQDFVAIESLEVSYCDAKSIDVSSLTHLKTLSLYGNNLDKIDLSHNLELTNLNLGNSGKLKTLDVSANTALIHFEASGSNLYTLDLSHNSALTSISLGGRLVNLNIANGNNNNVTRFWAANCAQLSCVKVDAGLDTTGVISDGQGNSEPIWSTFKDLNNVSKTTFSTTDCGVYTLIPDVGFQYYLTTNGIAVADNKVLTSDVSGLTTIDFNGDYNVVGDFSGLQDFAALKSFKYNRGGSGMYSEIDFSENSNLTYLEISDNTNLTVIDLSHNTLLETLKISNNGLTKLDISNNPKITELWCNNNKLSYLNLKNRADKTSFKNTSNFKSNPKLTCIEVDDIDYATANWMNKDAFASYYTAGCPTTAIPDPNFEKALIYAGLDDVVDGKVFTHNIAAVEQLNIGDSNIADLTGIEEFSSLLYLDVSWSELTKLDVSKNILLTDLYVNRNHLKNLDVSKNNALVNLSCGYNQITKIDISSNKNLKELQAQNNPLVNVNLKGSANNINYLDLRNTTNLTCIAVDDVAFANNPSPSRWYKDAGASYSATTCAQYTIIPDPAFEQALINQNIDSGVIDGKVATESIATIQNLNINTNISDITGIQDFVALTILSVSHNSLSTLDLSKNTALTYLDCSYNNLTTLNLNQNASLTYLDCGQNQLSTLDVSNSTALTSLYCYSNQLKTLDLSKNTQLTYLVCQNNKLTSVNLKNDNNTLLKTATSFPAITPFSNGKTTAVVYPIGIFGFQANDPSLIITVDSKSYSDTNWSRFKDATAIYVDGTTLSVPSQVFENLVLAPNPTQGELSIYNLPLDKIVVYNLLGNVVKTARFDSVSTTNTLDLSHVSNGVYLVKITSNGVDKTVKIVKN